MQKNLILEQMYICDFSQNHVGKTHDSDSTLDHVNSDCKNNVRNVLMRSSYALKKFLSNRTVLIIE